MNPLILPSGNRWEWLLHGSPF